MFIMMPLLVIGAICIGMLYRWSVKEDPQTRARNRQQRLEQAHIAVNVMSGAYASGDLKPLENIFTKELYRQELATAQRLEQFGLHKEIRITDVGGMSDNQFANLYDGKVNSGIVHITCGYTCEYKEGAQTCFAIRYPKARVLLSMIKSVFRKDAQQMNCPNCGHGMTMHGDYLECPYCSTQFSADSASWIIHGWTYQVHKEINIENPKKAQAKYSLIAAVCLFVFAPLMMFVGPFFILAIPVLFIGFIIYSIRQILRAKTWEKIQAYDANFSQNLMKTRIWNLVQTVLYEYKSEDRKGYQDMVTPEMEEQLEDMRKKRKFQQTELLDLFITKCESTKFYIRGDEQLATFECVADLIELTGRVITSRQEKLKVTLSRPKDSMTPMLLEESYISCSSCGASMDVSTVRCPYCDRVLNVNGWRLERIKGL